MDRQIVYPASIPLDTDFLSLNRNTMAAIGNALQAALGTSTVADGLICQPTTPASLTVTVGAGSITQFGALDTLSYGSLPADASDQIVKMGINLAGTSFAVTPPATSGQSIIYLIEASFSESDTTPVVLPYVNAADPSQPYSGPANSGTAQNTQRIQRVQLQLKAGAAANTGTQLAPAVDSGWSGLYLITVNNGQSTITAANIATHPAAPFVAFKLPVLTPGFSRRATFAASTSFTVPLGVRLIRATVVGGGGAGGGTDGTYAAAGGGAGGFASGTFSVTPGVAIAVTVGSGGIGGAAGVSGGNGGASSFGTFLSATGGQGGQFQDTGSTPGGSGGQGSGGDFVGYGGCGSDGQNSTTVIGGQGGASLYGGGGRASTPSNPAINGQAPGSGAGGIYNGAGNGGQGAGGVVILEY
ncbi:hypothetical protein ACELLULO517_09275 [Acidisoma cellulosilytica]|uniref:Glycine-rich domain-containing protein n=1 Tax=Acidisoma cellulosilyticum TaxID=2802395 RepID=A0A963Z1T8_9PROT|nr:hypothetical protein [Acidisoma cellulosilyticum]MCB8880422.1 hypothetical protein [Acidisoma cellulosilyticum]